VRKQTNVTPMPCVPTVRDRMSVAVGKDMREMEDSVKVFLFCVIRFSESYLTICCRNCETLIYMTCVFFFHFSCLTRLFSTLWC